MLYLGCRSRCLFSTLQVLRSSAIIVVIDMAENEEPDDERTHLLPHNPKLASLTRGADAASIISSTISKEEQALSESVVGEVSVARESRNSIATTSTTTGLSRECSFDPNGNVASSI
jgi:hypothetical protein